MEKRKYDLYVLKEILDNIVSDIKTFLQNNLQKYKLSSGELTETHQEVDLASKRYSNLIKRRAEDEVCLSVVYYNLNNEMFMSGIRAY